MTYQINGGAIKRLQAANNCRRCDCRSCTRSGSGELHDHVCTGGKRCAESRPALLGEVKRLRDLCAYALTVIDSDQRKENVEAMEIIRRAAERLKRKERLKQGAEND